MPLRMTIIALTILAAILSMCIPGFMSIQSAKLGLICACLSYFGFYMAMVNSGMVGYVSQINDRVAMSAYMLGCSTNCIIILFV